MASSALLACDDEPCALELIAAHRRGVDHVAYELGLSPDCSLRGGARAPRRLRGRGEDARDGRLRAADADGNGIQLLPYASRRRGWSRTRVRRAPAVVGHPRKLGHVNFLTGALRATVPTSTPTRSGCSSPTGSATDGVWFHVNSDHHVMALVDKGDAHFHHLAFDVVDIGQMRVALDHLGRHGRWLGWGPARHGVGGNIASYVRIVEEECFVELYCDMEQLQADHQPRVWPDRPLLVEHLGAAAAALLLPLRPGGDRVRAREPRDARNQPLAARADR